MKRILVALDGSPRAPLVLGAAAQLARLSGARLVLFSAIGLPPELPPDLLVAPPSRVEESLRAAAMASLEQSAATIDRQLIEAIATRVGTAWDGILQEARERDADLVMLGSHGYRGVDRVLGTTAAKVVNHADRNVLVVRTAL
jgi:nucleotide-binding universal stress UspA family protein